MPMPQPEVETVGFSDWAMLDRRGRTRCHNGPDAARVAVKKNKTAAPVDTDGGPSCYVSFTLAAPPKGVSYLNLHWPEEQDSAPPPAYPYVRATDKDLILFDIAIPPSGSICMDTPPDLFVYKAGKGRLLPSVQRLPPCTKDSERPFLMSVLTTGILRLTEDNYIVADLKVFLKKEAGTCAQLCVFKSVLKEWRITPVIPASQPQDQSNDFQFPNLWSTDNVLAFDSRFLCWIDYFSGVLLCDISKIDSPALRFVPFPGEKEYAADVRTGRCFPERYRSVSISQGKMCFVHIDNDYHDRLHKDWQYLQLPEKSHEQQQPPHKITIWTLNSKFKWVPHHVINLHRLWRQPVYRALGIHQRLPEFPIISVTDPNVLCCMLREKEFGGKGWMIILDNYAFLQSCTPESESVDVKDHNDPFPTIPLLPTVFCNYLESPTGMTGDNDKVATVRSKKHKKPARFLSRNCKPKCARLRPGIW